jgi:3-deoxy-manno-octulosonate cytidylyltransferase (CMP-KDO synthetase)
MSKAFHVMIPARFESSRLPGKLLLELNGQSVLERTYKQALKAKPQGVTIATDNESIVSLAQSFGATVEWTKSTHQSGTDRLAEVVERVGFDKDDIIVNVQGDEPFIDPSLILQVVDAISSSEAPMATLCWPIESTEERDNPNVVKVVRDKWNNALYFSRSVIPAHRSHGDDISLLFRHIGLYAYKAQFLVDIVKQSPCQLELTEGLEQLRMLWLGHNINVEEACTKPLQDINTPEDLKRALALCS